MKITKTLLSSTLIIFVTIFVQFATPSPAYAAGITVNILVDEVINNASCSLREAIIAANTDSAYNGCTAGAGSDAITFSVPGTITLGSALSAITSTLSINGGGTVTVSGNNTVRIFDVQSGTLTLDNITLAGGNSGTAAGGAIFVSSSATVNITNSTFSNNTSGIADFAGGAIHNAGTATITGSTFSGNSVTGSSADGGAIYSNGTINISNSTFYNNSANPPSAGSTGSAIRINGGTATITHVTISNNSNDPAYGALDIGAGNVTISRSILANSGGGGFDCSFRGGTLASTSNLVRTNSTSPCTAAVTGDPLLGALTNNGGSTQTMALGAGSPAIDAGGTSCGVATDQRGVLRPLDGDGSNTAECDLGAYEVRGVTTTTITSDLPDPSVFGQAVTVNFTVTSAGGTPTGNVTVTDSASAASCTATVALGTCNITLNTLGARTLTATYAGDTNFAGSSDTEAHTVNQASTTTTITSDLPDPSAIGQAVTVNYTVTSASGTPTGNVTVTDSASAASCTATVAAGTCNITLTTSGARTLTATYAGDTNFAGSTSAGEAHAVNAAPAITSANATTFTVGAAGTFTVTTTGYPIPTITHTAGALPTGVTFTDNGNGTATLAGTPAPGTANAYTLNFVASNGVNPDASQTFTLTVTEEPTITSADNTAFAIGSLGSFTVTTGGSPTVTTITSVGALPANVTFTDNGNGTATLSGIPQAGTDGTYNLIFTASNGVGMDAVQNFTLTVNLAPPPKIAADGIGSVPDSGGGFIAEAEIVTVGITRILVTFDQDVRNAGSADPDSVTNTANYILVRDNGDGIQTTTCALGGGVVGGDIAITIDSVTYNNNGGAGPFIATLNLNGGLPLIESAYRLIVCGTSSITNTFGVALAGDGVNSGTDFTRNFVIAFAAPPVNVRSLPATGFPMGVMTDLPAQPTYKAYAAYGDLWLEIPKLNLKMSIVGVPQTEGTWDVTWLDKNAGYLQGTAFPTWNGNTVLTGHVWDAYNNPGPFAKIKNLRYGDQVKIHAFGQVYTYEVRDSRLVSPRNIRSTLKHEDLDWVSLLTCEDFKGFSQTYSYRRMVRAVLVNIIAE